VPAPEPLLTDDPYTLAMAEDATQVLRSELGREASVDEILERIKVWQERNPIQGKTPGAGYAGGY